ncbi:MAG: hypothetical protein ACLP9L_32065 [Thermoguttaceae bacterium]
MVFRRFALWSLLLTAPCLIGCGKGSVSSIHGNVTYEGAPVKRGRITFTPCDGRGKTCGGAIEEGKYTVTDMPPGRKMVRINSIKEIRFHKTSGEAAKDTAGSPPEAASGLPVDAQGNDQIVETTVGAQELNFDLKRPAEQ